jgi:hypothetical protein
VPDKGNFLLATINVERNVAGRYNERERTWEQLGEDLLLPGAHAGIAMGITRIDDNGQGLLVVSPFQIKHALDR